MLELCHDNMSVCARKVRLVLAEKGIEAVEHHLDPRAGDQPQPDYLELMAREGEARWPAVAAAIAVA